MTITNKKRKQLSNNAALEQMSNYIDKEARARRVVAKTATDADNAQLQAEIDGRGFGETLEELANKQIKLADALCLKKSYLDGIENAALYAIEQAKSQADIVSATNTFNTKLSTGASNGK